MDEQSRDADTVSLTVTIFALCARPRGARGSYLKTLFYLPYFPFIVVKLTVG